ncbi:hypothetical protein LCGC14_0356230 [marine sediment metagenome]|uniref:Uncharacterized protein n=1 Tax=marine sediment metagenome TaxID=412755 RepID=A0A0F9VWQ3_9ZZZZ
MKEQFIADKQAVYNLQNLRWVRKSNCRYGGKTTFDLQLCYNVKMDGIMTVEYATEETRDEIYDRIVERLIHDDSLPKQD